MEPSNPSEPRRRLGVFLALGFVLFLLVIGASLWWFSRSKPTPPAAESTPPAANPLALAGESNLRPIALKEFLSLPRSPRDSASLGEEIDKAFYYPQDHGIERVRIRFRCDYVRNQLQLWMRNNQFPEEEVEKADLTVLYSWTPDVGASLEIEGWSDQIQRLEKQRHTNILKGMAELIVPRKHASFLADYKVEAAQKGRDVYVVGTQDSEGAALKSFQKLYLLDLKASYIAGFGKAASFESFSLFDEYEGRLYTKELASYVNTENATLRYVVKPEYEEKNGFLLATRISQLYVDDQGAARAYPVVLDPIEVEVSP